MPSNTDALQKKGDKERAHTVYICIGKNMNTYTYARKRALKHTHITICIYTKPKLLRNTGLDIFIYVYMSVFALLFSSPLEFNIAYISTGHTAIKWKAHFINERK